MNRRTVGLTLAATMLASCTVVPAASATSSQRLDLPLVVRPAADDRCTGTSPIVCTFPELDPGDYDVNVLLGDLREAGSTQVQAETRRQMLDEVTTAAGRWKARSFTVNVRDPQSEQNLPVGSGDPGLTLTFSGAAPQVALVTVYEAARRTPRIALVGDSTVTDQTELPSTGWGQRLPAFFDRGISVVNHSGSGESTVSVLAKPEMFDALVPQLRRGDLVLIQLAHNDKTTTAEQYRANLTEMVGRVRERGATPVLVTPIVRLRFDGDQLSSLGLIVTDQADLPAEMRRVATELGTPLVDLTAMTEELVESLGPIDAEPIYLKRINGDRTHLSEYGASVYAGLVAGDLRRQGLVDDRYWR